ncbi:MAG: carboxypeptidase regulatory-like domain-containing protein [Bacteroidia bacterium]|nr:carboxypeptidase regulatory-like domain-containing protein [Bacteroidia bacterium]
MKRLLFFISGLIFLLPAVLGQDSLQQIRGLVTDPDMRAVTGMQVSLFSGDRYSVHARTDSNGYFCIHTADTGKVKLQFRQGQYSFYSDTLVLGTRDNILMNIRYKGRPEIVLYSNREMPTERTYEAPLWREFPVRSSTTERAPVSFHPDNMHHRSAEMILQNWQYSRGENVYITLAPLNRSR